MVLHSSNPSAEEAETGRSSRLRPTWQVPGKDPTPSKKKKKVNDT